VEIVWGFAAPDDQNVVGESNSSPPAPLHFMAEGRKYKDWSLKKLIRQQHLLQLLLHKLHILQYFRRNVRRM
jgi:hypothetical protein